ncbi:hypothetical protein ASC97_01290 [Rhizobium sp. Root1203]|uniref:hypothetical protein n=1 Tax=Rhizobium sp. Root1203 TaxID=1736427 RepID=UPI00070FF17E|nr:hypothetical protein [Rhizobium sp. Root1203]KQV32260.1 hypothetical protein ASC97_01290 [Rhizobium sp. Root1203]
MTRSGFRKIDVTRAVQAVRAGGIAIGRVEIENGKIVVVSASETAPAADTNPLDNWLKSNARS